jgi:hypothetical protein
MQLWGPMGVLHFLKNTAKGTDNPDLKNGSRGRFCTGIPSWPPAYSAWVRCSFAHGGGGAAAACDAAGEREREREFTVGRGGAHTSAKY